MDNQSVDLKNVNNQTKQFLKTQEKSTNLQGVQFKYVS